MALINLKTVRINLGITRTELARLAGISEKTINKVEQNNLGKPETKMKILRALNNERVKLNQPPIYPEDIFKTVEDKPDDNL